MQERLTRARFREQTLSFALLVRRGMCLVVAAGVDRRGAFLQGGVI